MNARAPGPAAPPSRPRVYLAGPEVFLPEEQMLRVREAKLGVCSELGLAGVFPSEPDLAHLAEAPGPERAAAFFDRLLADLETCVAGIANLTPVRGPSADVGTVWEVGFLLGRGKPVWGYTNVVAHYRERAGGLDGHAVEDFGLTDNLMIDRSIWRSTGSEVIRTEVDPAHRLTDLRGFRMCADRVRSTLPP